MRHPFENINSIHQKRLCIMLLTLTVLFMLVMNWIGAPLYTPQTPYGVVSFELAFTPSRTQQMISSWSEDAQIRAAFIQGLDFLFPLFYSSALGLASLMASRVLRMRGKPLAGIGAGFAWGLWLAAIFDYIENIALVILLFSQVRSPYPQVAGICGALKFVIILVGILYALYGLLIQLLPGFSPQHET